MQVLLKRPLSLIRNLKLNLSKALAIKKIISLSCSTAREIASLASSVKRSSSLAWATPQKHNSNTRKIIRNPSRFAFPKIESLLKPLGMSRRNLFCLIAIFRYLLRMFSASILYASNHPKNLSVLIVCTRLPMISAGNSTDNSLQPTLAI